MDILNKVTQLPWTPLYTQQSQSIHHGDDDDEKLLLTFMGSSAMAFTILFTTFVFLFEQFLDDRQAQAYRITQFPTLLESTVGKIDIEMEDKKKKNQKKEEEDQQEQKSSPVNDDDKTSTATTAATTAATTTTTTTTTPGKTDKNQVDKEKPILPQLKEKFTKSQAYGMDKISFGMISSVYGVFESILFLLMGFLPYIWDISVNVGQKYGWDEVNHEIKITLIFMLITTIIGTITGLPFELYSTFKIEKKHGFNKQTPGLFFTDKVKSLLLTFVIGGPFISILLKIIKWGGDRFYIYVWAFMFAFSVFMMTIAPVFIMPLFNKYEPLPDGALKTKIFALADRLQYPLTKLFVMDGSKRSSHSNAFMFGFGKNKRIVLFDTLMDQVDDDEILAILGHELGHWKLGHTVSSFVVTQLYFGASFYCFSLCYNSTDLYRAFGFDGIDRPIPTLIALLLFFQTLWAPIDKILSFLLTINSRRNEFQADKFSADLGMSAKLQTGLCKISLENLGAMCPDPWYAVYHYSHPPLVERLSAMMTMDVDKKTK